MVVQTKYRKIIAIILALVMTIPIMLSATDIVIAGDAEDLKELEENIEANENKLESQKKLVEILFKEIRVIDGKIEQISGEILYCETKLEEVQDLLDESQKQYDEAVKTKEEKQKIVDERVAVMYKYGDTHYWDIIFSANNFADLISKIEMVSYIVKYDKSLVAELKATENLIAVKKKEIEKLKAEVEEMLSELEDKKGQLISQQNEKDAQIAKIRENEVYFEALIEKDKEAADELREQMYEDSGNTNFNPSSDYLWPTPGYYGITDPYGYRVHPISGAWRLHTGTDIGVPYGKRIVAPANAVVVRSDYHWSFGENIILDCGTDENGNNIKMRFAHASVRLVSKGDFVSKGKTIALVGSTGSSTGAHLHFEIWVNDKSVDPMLYY